MNSGTQELRDSGTWAVVATVRAPRVMVDKFISHYRNLNATEIHIFFDDPNVVDFDSIHLSDSRVNVYICDEKLWSQRQGAYPLLIDGRPNNVEGRQFSNYLSIQKTSEMSWILNVDVDEFLLSNQPLGIVLKNVPANIFMLGARTLEAVYQSYPDLNSMYSVKYFKNTYTKNAEFVKGEFDAELIANEHGFWGHRHGKGFFRREEKIKKLSCHYPTPLNQNLLQKFQHKDIELLHYECMTFELFNEKRVRRIEGSSLTTRISANNRARLEYFKRIYERLGIEGARDLYARMNIFSGARLDKAKKYKFLVEKVVDYAPSTTKVKDLKVSSHHDTTLACNFDKCIVQAIENKFVDNINYCEVYIEHELPKSGVAYLYVIKNSERWYIYPGEKGELVLGSRDVAYFFKYKFIKNQCTLSLTDDDGREKFLTTKRDGSVGFYASDVKAWEQFTFSE